MCVSTRKARPLPCEAAAPSATDFAKPSHFAQSAGWPAFIGVRARCGSYSLSTSACAQVSEAPSDDGWFGLPSIFVGRPSWASTVRPSAPSPRCIAVA